MPLGYLGTIRAPLAASLLLAALATGCGDDGDGTRAQDAGADADAAPTAPLVMHPAMFTGENEPLVLLEDGDEVDVQLAVQGGQVIYIAAQLENLDDSIARIATRLVDPASGDVRQDDERSIVMKPVEGESDLWQPDIRSRSQVSHLVVCPNSQARSVIESTWDLEITMSNLDRTRSVTRRLKVTPVCRREDATEQQLCVCQCEADYEPGKCN